MPIPTKLSAHSDERHVNVLIHAPDVVRLLADEGVEAEIGRGFDDGQRLEEGLVAITGVRRQPEGPRESGERVSH